LLEAIFALPHEFAVPDVLYDHEMRGDWGDGLVRLGLRVEEVSKEGLPALSAIASNAHRSRCPIGLP
jgi:hypothetical protein